MPEPSAVAIQQSVQDQEPDNLYSAPAGDTGYSYLFGTLGYKSQFWNAWGTHRRAVQMRHFWHQEENALVIGALSNLINRMQQTPWELVGPASTVKRWHDVMQGVQFGDGWDAMNERLFQDYLGQDKGAFLEVIGPGSPDTMLDKAATGVAVLDSLRCYVTGNPEFPVWYRSHRTGKYHKLHWSRVLRFVDMPSPDPAHRGMGTCALSRAAAIANTQYLMARYRSEQLADLPPKGFVTFAGIDDNQLKNVMNSYEAERDSKGAEVFGGLIRLTSVKLDSPVDVNVTPFSNMPDGFNYESSMDNDVKLLALAIGDDPLEIWPLTGAGLNNSGQAQTLHAKGKARMLGKMRTLMERQINLGLLPRNLELKYKPKDTEQEKQDIDNADRVRLMAQGAYSNNLITLYEGRRILANATSIFSDVLLDDQGEMIRLPDDDRMTDDQEKPVDVSMDESAPHIVDPNTQPKTEEMVADDTETKAVRPLVSDYTGCKTIQATRTKFEDDLEGIINAARDGSLTRRRFAPVMRSVLSRAINSAFEDGLEDGGVDPRDKSDDDNSAIVRLIADANQYVSALSAVLYSETGISDAEAAQKPTMWYNKSISPAYDAGRMSADRNGLYEWVYGSTEHCSDCRALNGQIHRLRDYVKSGWMPQSDQLECKGYNCKCRLVKRTGVRARGRFPRKSLHLHDEHDGVISA